MQAQNWVNLQAHGECIKQVKWIKSVISSKNCKESFKSSWKDSRINNINAISAIRSTMSHFNKLAFVIHKIDNGLSLESAMSLLKPRIFFKQENEFISQVNKWSFEKILHSQQILLEAEIQSKTSNHLPNEFCERALLRIASAVK